jgi:hypothetical protein
MLELPLCSHSGSVVKMLLANQRMFLVHNPHPHRLVLDLLSHVVGLLIQN